MEKKEEQEKEVQPEKETTLLAWKSPEFVTYNRTWQWYLIAGILFFIVFAYSIYKLDWFIAILTVFTGTALFLATKRQSKEVEYKITQLGFYVDNVMYPFNELHSFWMLLNSNQRVLNIIFRKKYLPALPVLFYDVDPVKLRTVLTKYLPEQEERIESLSEKLIRILKI
jgi:hypothetical protein